MKLFADLHTLITKAPLICLIAFAVAAFVGWRIAEWQYRPKIDALDRQIAERKAILDELRSRVHD